MNLFILLLHITIVYSYPIVRSGNIFNNTSQRSLFGTGDNILLTELTTSQFSIGYKIYFKNGYFAIFGYKSDKLYHYFLFDNNGHRLIDYIPIFNDISFEINSDKILNVLEINDNLLLVIIKGKYNDDRGIYYIKINLRGEYLQDPTLITNLEISREWNFQDSATLSNGLISNLYTYSWIYSSSNGNKYKKEAIFGITFNSDLTLYGSDYVSDLSVIKCSGSSCNQQLSQISINSLPNGRSIIYYYKDDKRRFYKKLLDINFYGDWIETYNYIHYLVIVTDNHILEFGKEVIKTNNNQITESGPQEIKIYDTNGEYIDSYDYSEFPFGGAKIYYKISDNSFILSGQNLGNRGYHDFEFSLTVNNINYNFYFKGVGNIYSSTYKYYYNYDNMYNNIYFNLFSETNNQWYISRLDFSNDIDFPIKLNTPEPDTNPDYSIIGSEPTINPTARPTTINPTARPTTMPTNLIITEDPCCNIEPTSRPSINPTLIQILTSTYVPTSRPSLSPTNLEDVSDSCCDVNPDSQYYKLSDENSDNNKTYILVICILSFIIVILLIYIKYFKVKTCLIWEWSENTTTTKTKSGFIKIGGVDNKDEQGKDIKTTNSANEVVVIPNTELLNEIDVEKNDKPTLILSDNVSVIPSAPPVKEMKVVNENEEKILKIV